MTKRERRLAIVLMSVMLICALFCLVACGPAGGKEEEHIHTYAEEWTRSATEHWHEATCDHTDEKGDLGTHIDSNNDGKCDVCDYTMKQTEEPPEEDPTPPPHTHTFDESSWAHDASTHWHPATCTHSEEKSGEAPHVDEDENQFCDVCGEFIEHVHKFDETKWLFDEAEHWHEATCTHRNEKGSEAEHVFVGGVCVCGVKESEVDVYDTLIELEMTEETFVDWLALLQEDGVTEVRKTEKGDILYDRDGVTEEVYVAERTVKVEARIVDGGGLADVWFKVAYDDADYLSEHGTDALAVAKTGADGVATIAFIPVGGYTTYKIMLAEARDVAMLLGEDETNIKVIPARYTLQRSAGKGEVCDFEVAETDDTGDVLGSLDFKYDMSWAASDKKMLSYERYYEDPVTGAGAPIEKADPDTFIATGGDTFDYLLFSPAHGYDWSQGSTVQDFDKIADNYRKSASGVYEISFTVSDGTARLYYWDGIDLANGQKESDGSPSNIYVKSVSGSSDGSTVDSGAFTGENKVSITIEGYRGLEDFQLGIKCSVACQVTITVRRMGDYTPPPPEKLKLGLNTAYTGSRKGYEIKGASGATGRTQFEFAEESNITDGWYTVEVIPYDEYCIMSKTIEIGARYYMGASLYSPGVLSCSVGSQTTLLWQPSKDGLLAERYKKSYPLYNSDGTETGLTRSVTDFKNVSLKGVIYLTSESNISILCNVNVTYYADIKIEPYTGIQTLTGSAENIEKDTTAYIPATQEGYEQSFEFGFGNSIDESTKYRILFTIPESYALAFDGAANTWYATLTLGGIEYRIDGKRSALWDSITFELHTKIKAGDKLKITSGGAEVNIFMAEVNVSVSEIGDLTLGTAQSIEFAPKSNADGNYIGIEKSNYLYSFAAPQSGTYRLHIELADAMEEANAKAYADGWNSNNYVANLNALEICNLLPAKVGSNTKYMYIYGKRNFINMGLGQVHYGPDLNKNSVTELDLEFSLNAGEEILFNINEKYMYMGISLTVQRVQ